jgi:hypothetical protein
MRDKATTHAANRQMPLVVRECSMAQVIDWRWPISPSVNFLLWVMLEGEVYTQGRIKTKAK